MIRLPLKRMTTPLGAVVLFTICGPVQTNAEPGKPSVNPLACPCPSCGGAALSSGKTKADTKASVQCPLDAERCCQAKAGQQAKTKPCCETNAQVAGASTQLKRTAPKPVKLTDIAQLKERFNKDVGTARMILLLSTTCPVCVDGAQRVQQELLSKHPDAKLKLYVIWEQMLPSDVLRASRQDLIPDRRAIHFKDPKRVSGRWFSSQMKDCPSLGQIAWDAFYLYDADAKWDAVPGPTRACGTPVVKDWEVLSKAITPMLIP